MSDEYKIQINTTIAGDLFNFRAGTGEELKDNLESVAEHAVDTAEALAKVKTVFLGKAVMTGTTGTTTASSLSSAAPPAAPGGAVRCKHDECDDQKGKTTKAGKLYQWRYYCSAPLNADDKCKPNEIPGNEKQS